jgi:DNA-binding NarL/FixJ family response regulator
MSIMLVVEIEREIEQARRRARSGEMLEVPTEAELAVLRVLATDLSAREIGGQLFLSPNRSHTRAIYRKMDVHSPSEAVARRRGRPARANTIA